MAILIGAVCLCAALGLIWVLVRWTEAGLCSLLGVEFFDLVFGKDSALIGHLHLSALDAVSMTLLAAGAIRFARSLRTIDASRLLVTGYLVLFVCSFVRGYSSNGLLAAANEARGFVGPLAAMLYFANAPASGNLMHRVARIYLIFAAGLCTVMLLAVAGLSVGLVETANPVDDRVLPSAAAATIAICGFFAVARATYVRWGLTDHILPVVFFAAAIALRHRTVWVMLLAGIVMLLFVDGKLFRRAFVTALLASAVVAGVVLLGGAALGATENRFAQGASSTETWQWRVNGWQEFLCDEDQTPVTVLAGRPMGSGWWRIDPESHLLQTAPPHSEYVTEYLRVGALGLLLVVLFASRPLWALWRTSRIDNTMIYPATSIWIAVAAMTLVYGITYSIEPEAYAFIGMASATVSGIGACEGEPSRSYAGTSTESSPGFAA